MSVTLSFIGGAGWQFFDNNGNPLLGGKIHTYAAGTTTPLTTYTSQDGLTANSNPIILDSAGRVPQEIWVLENALYKYVVTTSSGILIRTWDNVGGVASSSDLINTSDNTKGDALVGFRQASATGFLPNAISSTVHNKLTENISVKDFGAVGDGVTDDTAAINAAYVAAETLGGAEVYWPAGNYATTGTITCGPLSSTRASSGAILTYSGSSTAMIVQGVNSSETVGQFNVLPYINKSTLAWNTGGDITSIGLILQDRKYSTFVIQGIKRFNEGLALKANVANFVCNTIQVGVIQNCKVGIDFSRVTVGYGINQNTFVGGSVVIDSAYTSASGRVYINMPNVENNANTFVGVNLEKGGNEKAIDCNSSSNLWLNCRFEAGESTAGYVTISGNLNKFIGPAPVWPTTPPFVTWISDTGASNVFWMSNVLANKYFSIDFNSVSRPLRFGNGVAYPAVPIGAFGSDRLSLGDSATSGIRYNGYMLQEEIITTSGTTIPGKQHQQLNYAAPTTITNITGGFGQDLAGIFTLTDLNGNITLTHTATPVAGAGRFVLSGGVNLLMTANVPLAFVLVNGNLYQV